MNSTYSIAVGSQENVLSENHWLRSKTWDLTFISFSAVLVAVPIFTYLFANEATPFINRLLASLNVDFVWDADASRNLVNAVIALFIGGPHMYATYTRTALEPNFTSKHKYFILGSLFIPITVVILGVTYFQLLITIFFFWASVHIMHQLAFLMECYDKKARVVSPLISKLIDYGVVFSSLYPIATYKFVHDQFLIGNTRLLYPEFLKTDYVFYLVLSFFIASLVLFIWKTAKEIRSGTANYPKILLMSLTIVVAFFIPSFHNLDVAFQGFNAWHSFQYLALTYYINRLRHERGEIGARFIDKMSEDGRTLRYYLFNVGLTVMAVSVIAVLIYLRPILGLSFDQCYYIVVLSFLLTHYLHDHFLFTSPEAILA
jgi:hypothetical protein